MIHCDQDYHPDSYSSKAKAVPVNAMEALRRIGGIAPTHSRPGHALAVRKRPPVPNVQEVWTQRLEEKSFRLCRESNFDRRHPAGSQTLY
jgi:hypothetical protein